MKGKIAAQDIKNLNVTFYCPLKKKVDTEIIIKIRGGQIIKMAFSAEISIPEVRVIEDELDFGEVRYGNTGSIYMTLQNESELRATLILDLRENEWTHGVDGLEIKRLKQNPNLSASDESLNKPKLNEILEDEEIMFMLEHHPDEQHPDDSQD
jgi:hypothetical protein